MILILAYRSTVIYFMPLTLAQFDLGFGNSMKCRGRLFLEHEDAAGGRPSVLQFMQAYFPFSLLLFL